MNQKLTNLDVREWCKNNNCRDCSYMDGYCHISEFVCEECEFCMSDTKCNSCHVVLNQQ